MRIHTGTDSEPRSGFTLLELLIVIVVIGALVALLLPAIFRVFARGAEAEVATEITQLEQALQAFATKFSEYPPSSLNIPVVGDAWTIADSAKVRAIWPQFDFATNGGLGNDGAGGNPGAISLNGAECLVFFLGGIQNANLDAPLLSGFSKNPQQPWTVSENPDGPFMEFDLGRMSNVDGDTAFEYLDPIKEQSTPYMYISAAGKSMHRENDDNATSPLDDYDVFGDYNAFGNGQRDLSFCYVQSDGRTPHRKDSFQIISPGADGAYGTGGVYGPDVVLEDKDLNSPGNGIANEDSPSGLETGVFDPLDLVEVRAAEADNITNFSSGATLN